MRKLSLFLVILFCLSTALSAQQLPQLSIVNNTGYTIFYVFFSSADDDSWGSDQLSADEIIDDKQSRTFNLPHPLSVVDRYDIQLVDSDGDTYTKWNVQLSAHSIILFTIDDIDLE